MRGVLDTPHFYIIRIKHPIDGEGHVDILIHIRQIALWVMIFVQLIQ